jgi:hypothetical protein
VIKRCFQGEEEASSALYIAEQSEETLAGFVCYLPFFKNGVPAGTCDCMISLL